MLWEIENANFSTEWHFWIMNPTPLYFPQEKSILNFAWGRGMKMKMNEFCQLASYFFLLFHLSSSLLLAAAHIQAHPDVCFTDLNLIKSTVKDNDCTYMAEIAQFPEAAFQYCTGESLDWGSKSETKEQSFSLRQEGKRKWIWSQGCVELAGDWMNFKD